MFLCKKEVGEPTVEAKILMESAEITGEVTPKKEIDDTKLSKNTSSCCLRASIILLCFFYLLSFTCFLFAPFVTFERTHSRSSTTDAYNLTLQLTPHNTTGHNASLFNFVIPPLNETLSNKTMENAMINFLQMMENMDDIASKFLKDQEGQIQNADLGDTNNRDFTGIGTRNMIANVSQIEDYVTEPKTIKTMELLKYMKDLSKNINGGNFSLTKTEKGLYDHEFITIHIGFNEMTIWETILRFGIMVLGLIPLVIVRRLF